MEASIVLEVSKKAWDLAHLAGGSVIKNDAGEKYLILQGATGNTLISIAEQKDTIDEILVGLVGDVVQGFLITAVFEERGQAPFFKEFEFGMNTGMTLNI